MITVSFPDPAPRLNMNDSLHWRTRARRVRSWRGAAKVFGRYDWRRAPDPAYVQLVLEAPPRIEPNDAASGLLVNAIPVLGSLGSIVLIAGTGPFGCHRPVLLMPRFGD